MKNCIYDIIMITLVFQIPVELWAFETYFRTSAQEICAIFALFFHILEWK